jgi:hypothetical protein
VGAAGLEPATTCLEGRFHPKENIHSKRLTAPHGPAEPGKRPGFDTKLTLTGSWGGSQNTSEIRISVGADRPVPDLAGGRVETRENSIGTAGPPFCQVPCVGRLLGSQIKDPQPRIAIFTAVMLAG